MEKIIVQKQELKAIKAGKQKTISLGGDSPLLGMELPEKIFIASGMGHLAEVIEVAPVEIIPEEDEYILVFTKNLGVTGDEKVDQRDITTIEYEKELSDDDILEIAHKLVKLDKEEETFEREKKAIAAQWAAKLKDNVTNRKRLTRMIGEGVELIAEDCYEDPDYNAGMMVYSAVSTGMIVHERPLTSQEKQMSLLNMEESN